MIERATFAGGCFWCLHAPFEAQEGVSDVQVGYAGGTPHDAVYEIVASGRTGHREAITMQFDPSQVPYQQLLDIFWRQIDPTDPNGQFADQGHQYTTAIYYHTEDQRNAAEVSKQQLEQSGKFHDPLATAIEPFTTFFQAEEEHQQYYKKNPLQYQLYKRGSGRAGYIKKQWGT